MWSEQQVNAALKLLQVIANTPYRNAPNIDLTKTLNTPVNTAFSTSTTGGTLAAGTYYYRVSALNANGETLASTETSQVTTGTTSTVTVNWGAVAGATSYKVYGRSTGAELLMATVTGGALTFTDTGSITPSGALPGANTATIDYTKNDGFLLQVGVAGTVKGTDVNGNVVSRTFPVGVAPFLFASITKTGTSATDLGAIY